MHMDYQMHYCAVYMIVFSRMYGTFKTRLYTFIKKMVSHQVQAGLMCRQRLHTCTYLCACMGLVCVCLVYMCAWVYMCVRACACVCVFVCVCVYVHVCVCVLNPSTLHCLQVRYRWDSNLRASHNSIEGTNI